MSDTQRAPRLPLNFVTSLRVDGKQHAITTGPRGATGGFRLTVHQRIGTGTMQALELVGAAGPDGVLVLQVHDDRGRVIHSLVTQRTNGERLR